MSRPSTPHRPARLLDAASIEGASPPQASRSATVGPAEFAMQSPSTPPSPTRGRMSLRYPSALSRDPARVPLHKRGKSKTYEAMEDLLREAGYKETRIFTPETDRTERGADGAGRAASRVGAVVGYLAGLVPGMNRSEEHLTQEDSISNEAQAWSMPPSPLAGRNTKPLPPDSILAADRTTRIKKTAPGSPRLDVGRGRLSLEQPLRSQPSASESLRAYAQISAAHGYLRHMSSAPNIPRNSRLTSSTDSSATTSARIPLRHRVRDQIHEEQPPLPSGWLDSVTKAVLGSSTAGAHPGQPQPTGRTQAKSAARDRPRIHSHLALSDHTNKVRPMGSLRAQTAPGAVNTVMVVCRSAPSSRSSSRVGERLILAGDKTRRDSRSRATRRSRGEEADALPSLASTLLENDSWAPQWVDGMRIPSISVEDCEYSDDDDGEIDLAQLLLPPKRQKSIRSLRQHLQRSESARSSRAPSTRPLEPYILDDDDDVATRRRNLSRERRTHRWTSSDEGSGWEGTGILGTNQHEAKRRTGLPAAWSNMASGR